MNPSYEQDYYFLLGLPADASDHEIRRAYHRLQRTHHPDRGGNPDTSIKLNQAYETLIHPEKRAHYDSMIRRQQSPQLPASRLTTKPTRFCDQGFHKTFCPHCQTPATYLKPNSSSDIPAIVHCPRCEKAFYSQSYQTRKAARRPLAQTITWNEASKAKPHSAKLLDFSPSGAKIRTNHQLPHNKLVFIKSAEFEAVAETMWMKKLHPHFLKQYEAGLRFTKVTRLEPHLFINRTY